jgi:flagellar hook-length control protein FliK
MKTLQAGEKHLVLKLSPPDLGDIQITLKMSNGILTQ